MRLRSLRARILFFSGLGALLTGLFIGNVAVVWIFRMRAQNLAASIPEGVLRVVRECEKDPEAWRTLPYWPLRIDAFDAETLEARGANPIGQLDASLYQRMIAGEESPKRLGWLWGMNTRVLVKVPNAKRCGLLQAQSSVDIRNQGKNLLVLVFFSLIAFGGVLGLVSFLVVRPLLRRLQAAHAAASSVGVEGQYYSANDQVEDDLGAISRILDSADARIRKDASLLSQRATALEEHLADISHDVKTPLTALQLALENALSTQEPKEQKQRVASALNEVVYLSALLENLQLARQFSAELPHQAVYTSVDLCSLVEAVTLRATLVARPKGIEVAASTPEEPLLVVCDPTQVERALSNIAHNAVIYNKPGGHVALSLVKDGSSFCLSVFDDGPGVSSEELPSLGLRSFRSLEGRKRYLQGSGLGLSISCEVFRRLGWSITFSKEQPTGLRVEIKGSLAP